MRAWELGGWGARTQGMDSFFEFVFFEERMIGGWRLVVSLMRAGHVNDATAAVLGGAVTWIWAAIEKWNTPVKFILSQMALDYRVLELTVLLGKGISSKGSHAGGGAGSNHKAHAKYKIGQVKFMYKGKAP